METTKFVRRCAVTWKGINEGYFVENEWYSTQQLADMGAISAGYSGYSQMYRELGEDNDECYWSELEDIQGEIECQGYWYDAEGNIVFEMTDESGHVGQFTILDGTEYGEAIDIAKMNGVDDGENFRISPINYLYGGVYLYLFEGQYCADIENVPCEFSTIAEMKEHIDLINQEV